jgi:hypothetical protein
VSTVGGEAGFIALAVDGLLAKTFAGTFFERLDQLDWFVNKVLHRFNGRAKARAWIVKRAAKPDWVKSWVARERQGFAGVEAFDQGAAMDGIKAHLEKIDWCPPGQNAPPQELVAQDGFDLLGWKKQSRSDYLQRLLLDIEVDLPPLEEAAY